MSSASKPPSIGIDLGTSNSCVAFWKKGNVHVIANEQGSRTTPSYVTFNDSERLYGDLAKNQVTKHPKRSVFNVKRLIGCRYTEPHVLSDINNVPFTVQEESGWPKIEVTFRSEKRTFAPEEISAMILQKMKQIAETFIGEVKDAVISVPASFNDVQRRATIDAGTVAGLNVLRIINEPTAAAIAYGFDKRLKGRQNILVYDLGGGSFDVSIVEVEDGCKFVVKTTAGDAHLGGLDFDNLLVEHLVDEFQRIWLTDVTGNARAMQRLRSAAEKAKVALSSIPTTKIEIDSLIDGIDFNITIRRDTLEEIYSDKLHSTIKYVEKVIADAQMRKSDIHHVLLVGGSCRIPKIKSLLDNFFPGLEVNVSFNLEEAVAYGAAVEAARLTGDPSERIQQLQLSDVSSKYTGIGGRSDVLTELNTCNTLMPKIYQVRGLFPKTVKARMHELCQDGSKKFSEVGNFEATFNYKTDEIELCYEINLSGVLEVKSCEIPTKEDATKRIEFTYNIGISNRARVAQLKENSAKLRREEEVEKQSADARHQLEKYAYSVKSDLAAVESKFRDKNWEVMVKGCESLLKSIENNEYCDLGRIQSQLSSLQTSHQRYQRLLKDLIEEERKREFKRKELEDFANRVKSDLAMVESKFRNKDFESMEKEYETTLTWIKRNEDCNIGGLQRQLSKLQTSKQRYQKLLTDLIEKEKEKGKRLKELEKCAYSVKTELSAVGSKFRNKDWDLMQKSCVSALTWIENNQDCDIGGIQKQLTSLQSCHQRYKKQLKELIEKESKRERKRDDLEKYANSVKTALSTVEFKFKNNSWESMEKKSDATLTWIKNNEDCDIAGINQLLFSLQTGYKGYQKQLEELSVQEKERERKHEEFEQFVKKEIAEVPSLDLQEFYIPELLSKYNATLKWLTENPHASKESFDKRKNELLQNKADFRAASDRLLEEERQLIAALNTLLQTISSAESQMNDVDVSHRCDEWREFMELCRSTRNAIDTMKTKEDLNASSALIESKQSQVLKNIQEEIERKSVWMEIENEEELGSQKDSKEEEVDKMSTSGSEEDEKMSTSGFEDFNKISYSDIKDCFNMSTSDNEYCDQMSASGMEDVGRTSTPYSVEAGSTYKPNSGETGITSTPNIDEAGSTSTPNIDEAGSTSTPNIDEYGSTSTPNIDEASSTSAPNIDEYGSTSTPNIDEASSTSAPNIDEYGSTSTPNSGEAGKMMEGSICSRNVTYKENGDAMKNQGEDRPQIKGSTTPEARGLATTKKNEEKDREFESLRNELVKYIEELEGTDVYKHDSPESKDLAKYCSYILRWIHEEKYATEWGLMRKLNILKKFEVKARASTIEHKN